MKNEAANEPITFEEIVMIMINRVLGTTKSKYVLNYIHGKRMYHNIDLNRSNSNL